MVWEGRSREAPPYPDHAVFPSRRGLLPSVRALLDFLARECATQRQLVSDAAS